ncbi:MAG: hypothetical protein ACRBFS_12445 [Aureispira sp.]
MNEPTPEEKSRPLEQLQLFTTFGYLAFLSIGISKEILKYWVLDINILPYFNLTDIMMSPLEVIREDLVIVLMPLALILIIDTLRLIGETLRKKKIAYKGRRKGWIDWWANWTFNWYLVGLGYASFVLGIATQEAVSDAYDLQEQLEGNTLLMSHQLTFQDQEKLKVALIDQTGEFVFYVVEGEKQISISPVNGIIKRWVPLAKKDSAQ